MSRNPNCTRDEEGYVEDSLIGHSVLNEDDVISIQDGEETHCYDINTLYLNYRSTGKFLNPYTRQKFPSDVIDKIKDYALFKLVKVIYIGEEFSYPGEVPLYRVLADLYKTTRRSYNDNSSLILDNNQIYDIDLSTPIENFADNQRIVFILSSADVPTVEGLSRLSTFLRQNETHGYVGLFADYIESIGIVTEVTVEYVTELGTERPTITITPAMTIIDLLEHLYIWHGGEGFLKWWHDIRIVFRKKDDYESLLDNDPNKTILSITGTKTFHIRRVTSAKEIDRRIIDVASEGLKDILTQNNNMFRSMSSMYSYSTSPITIVTQGKNLKIDVPQDLHLLEMLNIFLFYENPAFVHKNIDGLKTSSSGREVRGNIYRSLKFAGRIRKGKGYEKFRLSPWNHLASYNDLMNTERVILDYNPSGDLYEYLVHLQVLQNFSEDYEGEDSVKAYGELVENVFSENPDQNDVEVYNSLLDAARLDIQSLTHVSIRREDIEKVMKILENSENNYYQYRLADHFMRRLIIGVESLI